MYNIAEKPWLPKPHTPYVLINAKLVDPRRSKVLKNMTIHLAKYETGHVHIMAVHGSNFRTLRIYPIELQNAYLDSR